MSLFLRELKHNFIRNYRYSSIEEKVLVVEIWHTTCTSVVKIIMYNLKACIYQLELLQNDENALQ